MAPDREKQGVVVLGSGGGTWVLVFGSRGSNQTFSVVGSGDGPWASVVYVTAF